MSALKYLSICLALVLTTGVSGEELTDPTRPSTWRPAAAGTAAPAPEMLQVQAIMRSGERHTAIVNGKLVRTGDRVGGATIQHISIDSVTYIRDGRTHVAKLPRTGYRVRQDQTEVGS